ncbi:MAG TPA: bifunctional DNA-formamidopyrimidine glycosylase/DNA-(apurinic or apyrimidinic site) lyase [Gemmatimonadales bacterium]
MPELPEVETIVRDIAPHLTGHTLHEPRLYQTNVLRGVSKAALLRALDGTGVVDVSRRAKHVVIELDSGLRLVIQPRMTGSLLILGRRLARDERRYAVLHVTIDDRRALVYRDVRRLGTVHLLDESAWIAYTGRIGPEPLEATFGVARFRRCLAGTRQAIKKVIMDQRRLAGVGNIYANEALFRARVHPALPAHRLDAAETRRLHRVIRSVLRDAIRSRGSTVRDYRTGTGGRGAYQTAHQVYGRGGEPCVRCGTTLTGTHAIDGRATTYCDICQATR